MKLLGAYENLGFRNQKVYVRIILALTFTNCPAVQYGHQLCLPAYHPCPCIQMTATLSYSHSTLSSGLIPHPALGRICARPGQSVQSCGD